MQKKMGRGGLGGVTRPADPAVVDVRSVKVEVPAEPLMVSDAGKNKHVAAVGRFEQLSATEPLKPPEDVTETLNETDCPEAMVAVGG